MVSGESHGGGGKPEARWPGECSKLITDPDGFTLIELLVVIAIIALLLAILIPVANAVRERGQRAVCLSNLHQFSLAWFTYANDHDGKLVGGHALGTVRVGRRTLEGWAGTAFDFPPSRAAFFRNPDKGPLWPYLRNVDIYRCPRGRTGHMITYSTLVSANNLTQVEGTYVPGTLSTDTVIEVGIHVGRTVLRLTNLSDIVSPGPAQRAVFIDMGQTPDSSDFYVYYLYAKWGGWGAYSAPPLRHGNGTTLSMADGHAEYWQWKGRETIEMPRELFPVHNLFNELLAGGKDYEVQTEDGLYDLQRLQRVTWGRLGYSSVKSP